MGSTVSHPPSVEPSKFKVSCVQSEAVQDLCCKNRCTWALRVTGCYQQSSSVLTTALAIGQRHPHMSLQTWVVPLTGGPYPKDSHICMCPRVGLREGSRVAALRHRIFFRHPGARRQMHSSGPKVGSQHAWHTVPKCFGFWPSNAACFCGI